MNTGTVNSEIHFSAEEIILIVLIWVFGMLFAWLVRRHDKNKPVAERAEYLGTELVRTNSGATVRSFVGGMLGGTEGAILGAMSAYREYNEVYFKIWWSNGKVTIEKVRADGGNFVIYKKLAEKKGPAKRIDTKLVGVTFRNDDGSDRQHLIKCLRYGCSPFEGNETLSYEVYLYENKKAIAVKCEGRVLGNLPANEVPYLLDSIESGRVETEEYCFVGGGSGNIGMRITLRLW